MHEDSKFMTLLYKLSLLVPDKWYIMLKYYRNFGRFPDLKNPKTFNEKLQWLKLHDHKPVYTTMVDKCEAKKYVANIIGEKYIIPTLGVWNRAEDIDFGSLPEKFVLKATHDSGRVIICKDKSKLDIEAARRQMKTSLGRNFYAVTREWPYKNVKPRIIAEKLLETEGDLLDYKVHNFNGTPRMILVCQDRFSEGGLKEDFYTSKWEHIDLKRPSCDNSSDPVQQPKELDILLELSEKLSSKFPFIRTDFYIADGKIYFGELTFFPASGMLNFSPETFDEEFGKWITLPNGGVYN